MQKLRDQETIGEVWAQTVRRHGQNAFIAVPANKDRHYLPDGYEITYGDADRHIGKICDAFTRAGFGPGHRVALLLENQPEHFLYRLALNILGVSCVPINPDYRPAEIAYLLEHSEPELVLAVASRAAQLKEGLAASGHRPPVRFVGDDEPLPPPRTPRLSLAVTPTSESCILYTSGTTGRPKGCIISHGYEVAMGERYITIGEPAQIVTGDRIYNPLPLYHLNSGVVSLMGAILSGSCQVQPDRFHPERWWREVAETRASVVHYLGVVIQMLMLQPASAADRQHRVRFGFGAGVEPQLHAAFEARFGFPLVEVWGMTEFCRVLATAGAPDRKVGTRAFGYSRPGLEAKVVDDADRDVPDGTPGELVVRHSAATPRRGAFSGYLKNPEETEKGWRGGWWHTGDTVYRAADGMLHFVDRKKNIIRRSGENIAAAEVEALLLTHPNVAQTAVLAVKDEVREEEVLACIVLKVGTGDRATAEDIFRFANERLAYYKPPGWIYFTRELPTTGTQKIQKHTIFPGIADPRTVPGMIDLRHLKRRDR
jgi:crotonobetaine/carnitine-CoA ligase